MRVGELMVLIGNGEPPEIPGEEVREPAFGMRAFSVPEMFSEDLKRDQFAFADNMSVLLTHLSEVVRNNLPQLLSYKDMKALIDRQDGEYKKLAEEVCSSHISYPGLQAVLKLLLAERVSIRNLHLIIEAVAEIAPHVRRTEQIVEHVRVRMSQQICGDLAEGGVLKVLRLGNRWDLAFHQALKKDAKGEVREFDIDPRQLEEFGEEASKAIRGHMEGGNQFALVAAPEARPYVRMIVERLFPTLPVLSHVEIARGVEVRVLGTVS
jgi:flagellar biosynthesis protein FlhA